MTAIRPGQVHLVTGGFPPGTTGGHDMDYARLRLLEALEERGLQATVGNDFADIHRWLPRTQLLITYVAGPFLDKEQNALVRSWLDEGGRWLGLHGSSGGKAVRVGEGRQRRMEKAGHHDTLGGFFINHPPIRRFQVDAAAPGHALLRDVPESFETVDEPYMIEVQHPNETTMLLTAAIGPDNSPPGFGFVYDEDTALQADGKTRAMGFTRAVGRGGVTYIALGHCHQRPAEAAGPAEANVDGTGTAPAVLRTTWETPAYGQLLRNAIDWGVS